MIKFLSTFWSQREVILSQNAIVNLYLAIIVFLVNINKIVFDLILPLVLFNETWQWEESDPWKCFCLFVCLLRRPILQASLQSDFCFSHHEVKTPFPLFALGLIKQLVLTSKMKWKWFYVIFWTAPSRGFATHFSYHCIKNHEWKMVQKDIRDNSHPNEPKGHSAVPVRHS